MKNMKKTTLCIAELDIIFLTYDEPQKEKFWAQIINMAPWAKRVDGVVGSDAAHKAAAAASDTERFILIDGDNLPEDDFFDLILEFPDEQWENAVYRWRAKNNINGLMYGNGGISSWTRTFINNMKTHENTDGSVETQVEFCFDPSYWAMHDCYSTTYPNGSPFQAWRAGFREGVKMCLDRGAKPSIQDFRNHIHHRNLDNLTIWHNVGRDVENGIWAILGARMGTYMLMINTGWDHTQVQDFNALKLIYDTIDGHNPEQIAARIAPDLITQLDLPITMLDETASKFFKRHYHSNWHNKGIMVREIDVIRKQEGW
jgi:hypothetical protein